MMKRIFIISNYPMFGHGLQSLLDEQSNIEIVGQARGIERASDQITTLQPDIVIFDSEEPAHPSTPALLYQILKENSSIKIVGLNLKNNKFRVYGTMQGIVHDIADLLKVIFQEPPPPA